MMMMMMMMRTCLYSSPLDSCRLLDRSHVVWCRNRSVGIDDQVGIVEIRLI